MVFLTICNFIRKRGPDRIWTRRRTMLMSATFKGRKRNCYSVALRNVHRALQFNRLSRPLKKRDMADLWEARVTAGCEEHGIPYRWFHEGLLRAGSLLNRKVLADLAAWEPRTFQSLTKLAWTVVKTPGGPTPEENKDLKEVQAPPPGVYNKKLLE